MPQLNPSPWLFILVLSWLTLMMLFLTKTQNAHFHSTPAHYQMNKQEACTWLWPWS
uniref:ATP synthase complex subunit 8 n=1 Tax=Ophisaurus attenuatus TaxID=102192 RepID=B3GT07_OPHAT|nr:ATP synthase F0 subunit 8 [Ophisaurus attenuatus]